MINLYLRSYRWLDSLMYFLHACFAGVWLGFMSRERLHESTRRSFSEYENIYHVDSHNRRGFFAWERTCINEHFRECKHLLVAGVGGGREALALCRLGYETDSFDPDPDLVTLANRLLSSEGYPANVQVAPFDSCPTLRHLYDGLVVGWGAYSNIQGRKNRISFLKQMHSYSAPNAPLLLSFLFRRHMQRRLSVTANIANLIRKGTMRQELVEIGDTLAPYFAHYFTEDEVREELQAAGFRLISFSTETYGHAVALAT